MEYIPHSSDTIAEMVFMDLTDALGATTVRGVFKHALKLRAESGEGVTYSGGNETINLTVRKEEGVNFRFGDWGPYLLSLERAQELLASQTTQHGDPSAA